MPPTHRERRPSNSGDHTLPGVHALHLVELAARWQVTPAELLAGSNVSEASLSDPATRLPLSTLERLIERARTLTGEPGLGFHLGLSMRISAHGHLGFAAMTATTLGDALDIAARFAPTRTTAVALRLEVDDDRAMVVIEERAEFGSARDVIIMSLIVGIWQIGNALTGRSLRGGADLAFPEPAYFARFASLTPGPVRFDQPRHQLIFDKSILDLPLVLSDPTAQRLAREQCERELEAIGPRAAIVADVRTHLPREEGGFHPLPRIAKGMHMSVRTLKRKLEADGTSYSELLDEQRRGKAMLLLRREDLAIEEIADRLGYSDAANFTRAFRRWTGITPKAFRASGRS
ncbi:MAG TPA: AraC family transcriptional regulator [Polyangiaceae bacterium]|jgi:AraC-like DNA-binding protein|nr:AraC family transcriptional regulator [Polyangiaceae bacterium]